MQFGSNLRRSMHSLAVTSGPLAAAQAAEFNAQVPHFYLILSGNAVLLAATHVGSTPPFLSVVMPAALVLLSISRVVVALRRARTPLDPTQAPRRLRSITTITLAIGLVFTAWPLSLLPYGDTYARCHVAFFMAITVVSCIFCQRHVPRAAAVFTVTVVVPFVVVFLSSGRPALIAIAINLVLVSGSILHVVLRQFADFADLIRSREELLERQGELERLSDDNLRLANQDSLTGLQNRRSFFASLEANLQLAAGSSQRFGVALIDLDGFKTVNDIHGHAAGDRLLVEAGLRLQALDVPEILFARLGGDEFAAVVSGDRSDDELLAVAELLCRTLAGRYLASEVPTLITGSVGIVSYPDGAQTAEQLFERADFALYHAKQTRKGGAVQFSAVHESMIREASLVELTLDQADLEREFELVFQPIVDATTGAITAFEALARWDSPVLGRARPAVFIRPAARSRTIGRLTESLFKKALAAVAVWPDDIHVAFNLSAQDIEAPARVQSLLALVAASGVATGRIDLEITETAMMRDLANALASLRTLREAGFRISLDDFGTGYSSLSQLHVLKPDKVKIDRSFIVDLETRPEACDIVRTSVELCRTLGLESVIEGVETATQAALLRSFGCRLMQGYFFSRPLDFDAACRAAEANVRLLQTKPPSGRQQDGRHELRRLLADRNAATLVWDAAGG